MIATLGLVAAHPGHGAAGEQRGRQRLHLPRAPVPPDVPGRRPAGRAALHRDAAARARAAGGLGWFLRHQPARTGDPRRRRRPGRGRARGHPAPRMATLAWAIAGGIAAFSAILVTPTTAGQSIESLGPELLLKGLAGAVIARMSSIPIAIARVAGHRRDRAGPALQPRHPRPGHRRASASSSWSRCCGSPPLAAPTRTAGPGVRVVQRAAPDRLPHAVGRAVAAPDRRRRRRSSVAVGLAYVVQQRDRLGAHRGRRLRAGRPQRRAAHRASPASCRWASSPTPASPRRPRCTSSPATGNFVLGVLSGVLSGAVVSVLVGIPAHAAARASRWRSSTLAFALATTSLAAAPGRLPRRRRRPGQADLVGLPARASPSTTTSSRCCCSRSGCGSPTTCGAAASAGSLQALRDNEDAARAFTVPARMRKLQLYAVSGALAGLGGVVIGHGQTPAHRQLLPDHGQHRRGGAHRHRWSRP